MNATRYLVDCFSYRVIEKCMGRRTLSRSFMVRRNRVRHRVRTTLAATEGVEGVHDRLTRPEGLTICDHDDESDNCKGPIKLDCKQNDRHYNISKCRDDIEHQKLSGKVSTAIREELRDAALEMRC